MTGAENLSPRLVRAEEGAKYAGLGLTMFRKWAVEIGAVRHFGRAARYDLRVIDQELDRMAKDTGEDE